MMVHAKELLLQPQHAQQREPFIIFYKNKMIDWSFYLHEMLYNFCLILNRTDQSIDENVGSNLVYHFQLFPN